MVMAVVRVLISVIGFVTRRRSVMVVGMVTELLMVVIRVSSWIEVRVIGRLTISVTKANDGNGRAVNSSPVFGSGLEMALSITVMGLVGAAMLGRSSVGSADEEKLDGRPTVDSNLHK